MFLRAMSTDKRGLPEGLSNKVSSDGKLFYRISEVSRMTGVKPYVLRYWESEFPTLSPRKNRGGWRLYQKKDIEIILNIKDMLYKERYTIEGVKRRLLGNRSDKEDRGLVKRLKRELKDILNGISS